jgi:hypothetical protein
MYRFHTSAVGGTPKAGRGFADSPPDAAGAISVELLSTGFFPEFPFGRCVGFIANLLFVGTLNKSIKARSTVSSAKNIP